jgi:RNA polymerase sigma-70 factor (ECF subfamily)
VGSFILLALKGGTAVTITPEIRDGLLEAIPYLRAFAISLSGSSDRADDLVQETIVRALSRTNRFEPGTNLQAWLFTILRNLFYTSYRKTRLEVEDPDGAFAARLTSIPEQESKVMHQDLLTALQKLSVEHREALLLVGAQGLSYEEAAEIAGVAVGTVKSRTHRARAQLAELLDFTAAEDLGAARDYAAPVLSHDGTEARLRSST